MTTVSVPGRVNLIGEHTDYTGGLVFPIAIDRRTTIEFERGGGTVRLESDDMPGVVEFDPAAPYDAGSEPAWGRYPRAVASLLDRPTALTGRISTTIPVGAGLSSSAALEIASALALGARMTPIELATLTRRAEHLATGVPTGIMDQLCIASAREGHGMLIDCGSLEVTHVPIGAEVDFVVRFIAHRTLEGSEYATRVRECALAEDAVGPLRLATMEDVEQIGDDTVRRRARHVVSENERVRQFIDALGRGNLVAAGRLMTGSHQSLSHDFDISTPQMDAAVRDACATPGVFGARMTGGGFGGCIVAMCERSSPLEGWRVRPSGGPTAA